MGQPGYTDYIYIKGTYNQTGATWAIANVNVRASRSFDLVVVLASLRCLHLRPPYDGNAATFGASSMCPTALTVSFFLTLGAVRTADEMSQYLASLA